MQNNTPYYLKINYIHIAKYMLWVSIIGFFAGIILLFTKGFSLGVDFAGGNQLRILFNNSVSVDRDSLENLFKTIQIPASITEISSTDQNKEFFIYYADESKQYSEAIQETLNNKFADSWTILSENFVGAKIGEQFRKISITSTLIIIFLILLYIAIRFDTRFGVAAIISLVHDIIFVFLFITLANISFSIPILAALLTIVGYSLNDTIVIFDRIRDEKKLMITDILPNQYYNLINISIGKSLTRTFLTSGTTLVVLLILYFIGGAELKPMALVLVVGVIVGTISSNFVAPPILYIWYKYKPIVSLADKNKN